MGEAMLGITVRRNAERLAYVLDSEITRKWMQGIKRLISVSQELFPSEDKGKMAGYTVHSMIWFANLILGEGTLEIYHGSNNTASFFL